MTQARKEPHHPHSKTRQKLRERLMREQVDHKIEERRESTEKIAEERHGGADNVCKCLSM